jgi:hypothetical protein
VPNDALAVSDALKRPQPHKVAAMADGTEANRQLRPHELHCQK